ncbi:spore germination protein YndE [Oxobacter pfennigii]|uniref:Spore germination protein YndE n=1 Tax=Oxobacter pfennigii TaxID=36849 RepID=A0A0P8WPU0_9CLOT|nr:endospore germination permease [Oxobacter pfennigii]KPU44579.1 spore germination protein YndE [Oxobacter pfennigii]
MIDNDKISNTQLSMFLILTMIGIGIFSLPRLVADTTQNDGWVTTILGGLLGLIDFYIICRLIKKYPQDTLVEIIFKLMGKFFGIPVLLIFAVYFIDSIAGMLRIFGEVVKMTLLIRTPIEVILISMILLALMLARCGIEAIVRFDEVVFLILFSMIFLGVLIAIPQADFSNLRPFFRTDIKNFALGTYGTVYSYSGFELVLFLGPFINKPQKAFRSGIAAFAVVILTYLSAVVLSFGYFGRAEVTQLIWPTLSLIRSIEVQGSFVERLEGIVMTQWILFAFTSIIAYIYALSILTSKIFKNKEFKHFASFFIPVVYIIAMIPDNVPAVYKFLNMTIIYVGTPALFVFPVILLVLSHVRKKGVQNNG